MKTETEGVYLLRGDGQTGPHTLDEVRSLLAQGWYTLQSLAWWEGAPGWVPLSQLPGLVQASSRTIPPGRAPGPPPPPSQSPIYTYSDSVHDDLSGFWGKVGSAFLIPLIGLVLLGAWLGFPKFGALFVFLGCYNAILSVRSCHGVWWRKLVAWSAVAASALYALMTLGMVTAVPGENSGSNSAVHGSLRATGKATRSAWHAYNAAFIGSSPTHLNSVQLEQVLSKLSDIDMRNVDPELVDHIADVRRLLKDAHRLVSDFETELRTIQSNTQTGGAALGMLFGAIAAEGSANDPYGDAFRAGQAAGELANEAGNMAVLQLQMKYRTQSEALLAKMSQFDRDHQRMRMKLGIRYGGAF